MTNTKLNLTEIADLTRDLFHAHYAGDPEQWFSYLSPDSVYLGTGEPLVFGGNAIQERFTNSAGKKIDIIQEEYYPIALGDQAAQVYGQLIVENTSKQFRVLNRFTITWQLVGENLKMIHQHNSYEYMLWEDMGTLQLDVTIMEFVRSLLLKRPAERRIPIRSGTQTVFVNPLTILYIQSQRNRTELVCIDSVISCNSPIGKLSEELPEMFYPLRRGYLVNTLYITTIRRFEVELITGICIPIPTLSYQQIKQDLLKLITKMPDIQ